MWWIEKNLFTVYRKLSNLLQVRYCLSISDDLAHIFFFIWLGTQGTLNKILQLFWFFTFCPFQWHGPDHCNKNIILSWVVLTIDHWVTFFPLIHTITLWIYMKKEKIIFLCWVFKEKDNMTIIYTRTSCKYLLGNIGQWNCFLKSTKIFFLLIKEKLHSEHLTVIVKDKYI